MSKMTDEPGPPDHVHTSACRKLVRTCTIKEHIHEGACGPYDARTCGVEPHGHDASCFETGYRCGFD